MPRMLAWLLAAFFATISASAVRATTGAVAPEATQTAAAQTPTARPAIAEGGLTPAPNRRADEGRGPFKTLVIRGVMLIDGSGAPPQGPVDVVVSGNRIASVRSAGTPGLALQPNRAPQSADLNLDATGMY